MRIPVSEEEIGYWSKIGTGCLFVPITDEWSAKYLEREGTRKGTFADFKKEYPYLAYENASIKFRSKLNYKTL